MIRIALLLCLGLLVFVASLVMTLPAAHAWLWFGNQLPIQAHGLRGTVWNGEAAGVIVEGNQIEAVRWTLEPRALLGGELRYRLQGRLDDGALRAVANSNRHGELRLEDVRFDADAANLVRRFSTQPLPVGVHGRIDGYFNRIELDAAGMPTAVDGIINWHGGAISVGETYRLGDYAVRLRSDNGRINGEVATIDATLRVDGDFRLEVDGTVTGEVIYQTLDGIHPDMVQGLQFLGIPEPQAENRISFEGNINNPAGFQGYLQ